MSDDLEATEVKLSGDSLTDVEKSGPPFFLNVAQVAQATGISQSTINRWIREKPPLIPSVKVAGMRLFPRPVLEEWCRRVAAEKKVPPHRLAQITSQLFDESIRQAGRSGQHAHSPSSSSGQRGRAKPEVGKGLRLRTRDMYRKYVLGDGDGRDE
jgi:predicted DNA-binding transcriptional regulator AlpA